MIDWAFDPSNFILGDIRFKIGDLVTTILGDYGIIVGFGRHKIYNMDETDYYHVLIEDHVHFYLPFALIKIKK